MKVNEKNKVTFLTFEIYKPYGQLTAVHSTRIGGVSQKPFDTMNLGFSRGDRPEDVHENYRRFAKAVGVPYEKLVLSDQWHHNNILEVDEDHVGMGIHRQRSYGDMDGLYTEITNLPLVTFYADCVPIYFYDPVRRAIGMTHAGWKGTASAIVLDMVDKFITKGSRLENLKIAIGPAVCKTCYQVDQKVIDAMAFEFDISEYYTYESEEDRYYIDLKAINQALLINHGLPMANIEVTDLCTKCRPDLFFSHRNYGNARGTQIGLMMLED